MADEKYLANRLKYHTASRIATQTKEALAQALNVDGHIVTTNKIWASPQTAFINNVNKANTDSVDATNDLVSAFKYGSVKTEEYNSLKTDTDKQNFNWGIPVAVSASFWNGGTVWTNELYPAVKLYENVPMTVVKGSDGGGKFQAFEVLAGDDGISKGTKRIVDWIAPTAVADQTTGAPVAGYSGIPMYSGTALKLADTTKWAEAGGHYEFAYIAGMLTFEPDFTPQNKAAAAVDTATGKTYITLTAFKYIGEYADEVLNTYDSRLDEVESKLGLSSDEEPDRSLIQRTDDLEKIVSGYTSTSTISSAISAEAAARIATDGFLSSVLSGYDTVGAVKNAIDKVAKNAAKYELSAITTVDGYAASYQLVEVVNDVKSLVDNSIINIPKDQFLSGASYNSKTETLSLTFAVRDADGDAVSSPHTVEIPVTDLIHEYEGASGVIIDTVIDGSSKISIQLADGNEPFLTAGTKGLMLSGVQDAIDAVSTDATTGLKALSGALSGYTTESAVSSKFTEIDGKLTIDEANISTLSSALSDYTGENAVSNAINALSTSINSIHGNVSIVSGLTETTSITGKISDNNISLGVKISETEGNAISANNDGLFVRTYNYKAGDNIEFGKADTDGLIPINNTFTLSAATADEFGGVKSGGDITVANDGLVTVNKAEKVKHVLTAFGASFDGSKDVTLSAGDYLTASNGNISLVVNGQIAANDTGLVTGEQIYELSGDLYKEIEDAAEELSGKISGAFVKDKVVIGDGSKLSSSVYSIGDEDNWEDTGEGKIPFYIFRRSPKLPYYREDYKKLC